MFLGTGWTGPAQTARHAVTARVSFAAPSCALQLLLRCSFFLLLACTDASFLSRAAASHPPGMRGGRLLRAAITRDGGVVLHAAS